MIGPTDLRARRARRFSTSQAGASAVEFAVLAPILLLILAAIIDLGTLVYTRMQIESAISAATAYAFANAENVSGENGGSLGLGMTKLLVARLGGDISADIVVNNGPRQSYAEGQIASSGSASQASQCHCLQNNGGALTWVTTSCGAACVAGGTAGRFVSITVRKPYQPLFYDYGMTQNSQAMGAAIARLQ